MHASKTNVGIDYIDVRVHLQVPDLYCEFVAFVN